MYAVIHTGGKQYRVESGQRLEVELVGVEPDGELSLRPVMLVDGDTVLARPGDLEKVSVTARVLSEVRGEKIRGFTYKNKSNQRKRWGHRQNYSVIEITGISAG
jgi:large subunit ribosomal protein L21